MLSSSLDTLLKVPKTTTSPQKLFTYDCVTLYVENHDRLTISLGPYSYEDNFSRIQITISDVRDGPRLNIFFTQTIRI